MINLVQDSWRHWRWYLIGGVVSGILIAILLSVWVKGAFLQLIIHLAIAVYIAPVAVGIAIVAGIWWLRTRSRLASRITRGAIALTLFLGLQAAIGVPIGYIASDYHAKQARIYCENLIPHLEQYQAEYNEYPETLDLLGDLPPIPTALSDETFYYRESADSYTFVVTDDKELFAWWTFTSDNPEWEYFVD